MEQMSEKEYKPYIRLNDKLERCLISCAQEISLISKDRELIGVWNEDIDLWDAERYFVVFEEYYAGDTSTDSVFVPIEYIYDEKYRGYYKEDLIKQKVIKAEETAKFEANRKARTYRVIVDELALYEELKTKFGD